MPEVDLVDATWIAASPARVATVVADPANWRRWWPELTLEVERRRGDEGMQWLVPPFPEPRAQPLAGSMEIWLEPAFGGVVLHYFLRLDPVKGHLRPRVVRRAQRRHAHRSKQNFWAVKDLLEARHR